MLSRMPDQPDEIVLHDNQADPYQLVNLASDTREVVSSLRDNELIPWLEKTHDPWLKNL
jgi:hypothetical protein